MVLCDLGADVIKVERPPFGDVARTTGPYQNGWSGYFFSINRGKRSISIDLTEDGLYTLSDGTLQVLNSIDEPIERGGGGGHQER